MRRTKIVIVAIALVIILTFVLLLNTKVQNIIVKVLHHKELKSYKLLANNGIASSSYEIKNVIHGSLNGSIMFDTLHKVFVMGTQKILLGRHELATTFWKVNTHGQILDSVTVPVSFSLAEDGLINSEKEYLDWVHTGEKVIKIRNLDNTSRDHTLSMDKEPEKAPNTLLKVTSEELRQFPEVSLQRSYFFKRKQRNGNFMILRPNNPSDVMGYDGPAYFELNYYGETMKFKAYDFESIDGPKSCLYLWGAPDGYESPQIHFLYLPDIIHLSHYSEVGIYVIRPKGLPSANVVKEDINGFFETSINGQDFALSETEQSIKLNMKTSIPLSEVSGYHTVKVDGQNRLSLTFTPRGTALFKAMTGRNIQKTIALVIQGRVVLTPKVYAPIPDGKIEITTTGDEELDYVIDLLDDQME